MKKIIDFNEFLECPLVNGIVFSDGTIQLLDVSVDWRRPIKYTVNKMSQTSIHDLDTSGALRWSDCAILSRKIDKKNSIEVIAGEGNYGTDGFIAVLNLNSKKLIWVAFFDCSNPFNEIKIIDQEVHSTSTYGCLWKFKLHDPGSCKVDCAGMDSN